MLKAIMLGLGSLAVLTSVAAAQAQGQQGQPGQQGQQGQQGQRPDAIVITIMTAKQAEGSGCWAKIYDGENYTGRTMTLAGEQSLPNLEFGEGLFDWEGDIDSIVVGPKATLTLYNDENYADKKRELKANEKVGDLHKTIFSEGVESMKLTCTP